MNVASSEILWPQSPLTNLFPCRGNVMTANEARTEEPLELKPVEKRTSITKVDAIVASVYFCNAFAITLPVILTPMIAKAYQLSPNHLTSFCGAVASIGIMGGGLGKIINGIVCQRLGGITTASLYLLGTGWCSLLLSLSTSLGSVRWLVAGMEFFSSAMWVASCLILSNHYAKEPLLFARGITFLSLSSTMAQLLAKTAGSALLQVMNWRAIARLGAALTLVGSLLTWFVLAKEVAEPRQRHRWLSRPISTSTTDQIKGVLKSPLFWAVGLGHIPGFIARTCDRMLGPFIADITSLPYQVCGSLTAVVTMGFFFGVMKGKAFFELDSVNDKESQLKTWYLQAVASILGFAFLAGEQIRSTLSPAVLATLVVLCSGLLSSSAAIPFFQLPNMVSTVVFKENKAICLAFLDGIGFFLTAPLWALSSRIVTSMGWSAAWGTLALVFALGGTVMVRSMRPVLVKFCKEAA